ncbi:MAG TPA: Hsp33 family molecular chaperone HslO [Planctomycetota bacterium]|nr:Hsp33 family molecular chaperone HslO [Planctomycetota bacterium]
MPEQPDVGGAPPGGDASRRFGPDRVMDVGLPGRAARLVLVDATETAIEAEFRHLAGRVAAIVMARAAAASLLIGSDLKNDERLAIQVHAEGPLKGFLVETDASLRFRGYTQIKALEGYDSGSLPYVFGLGARGRVQFLRSTAAGVFYRSLTALRFGDVAADLETALNQSQQTPSRLWLDHAYDRRVLRSGGALLQALPGAELSEFTALADRIATRAQAARPWPRDLDALCDALLPPDVERRTLSTRLAAFACRCTRERVVELLKSLGPPEEEQSYPPESRVTCVFCNDVFEIPSDELGGGGPVQGAP